MTLIELRKLAEAAKGWLMRPAIVQETEDDTLKLGHAGEDGEFYELIEIDCENYGQPSRPLAEFIAAANPAAVISLLDQIQTLQAENTGLRSECAELKRQWTEWSSLLGSVMKQRNDLQAERDELQADYQAKCSELELVHEARDALAAKLATLEADAERYRNLRRGQHWSVINGIGDELRAEALDAAIDAAKGGQQ